MENKLENQKELMALWDDTTSLPPVQDLMSLNWHRYLPPSVAVTFLGVAIALENRLTGDRLWREMEAFVQGVLRTAPTPKQKPYVQFVEKRFNDYYGDYERTTRGLVKVLTDLGLVVQYQRKGQDVMEIPAVLPKPETRLGLCVADLPGPVVFKARHRTDAGPRNRVMFEDLPAINQMLNAGWARHLPPDVAHAFLAAAAVSVGKCTGDLMWDNIEDLYKAQTEFKAPLMPKKKAQEVEKRFADEYGRPYEKTARGAIAVLLDLGILVQSQVDGKDFLEVPEVLPTPDLRLVLSEKEKGLLAERLKIKI